MQVIRHVNHDLPPLAVAIGNFDGMHQGHLAVIARMHQHAAEQRALPAVLTFTPHPRRFFMPQTPPFALETMRLRLMRLRTHGVHTAVVARFDAAFAALTPAQFMQEVLARCLNAKAVITGENFAFGARRAGTASLLREWGAQQGVVVDTVPALTLADGSVCSSSAIRHALEHGDMAQAAVMLGRRYAMEGRVVHGDGRGRGLGFATANVRLQPDIKPPLFGVYAVRAHSSDGVHAAVANVGVRPTIGTRLAPQLEVHLFDFAGNLYGQRLRIEFVGHIRAEKKFDSLPALVDQMHRDCLSAKTMLEQQP